YTARNFMRDAMRVDDPVLFYHSAVNPPAVVGVAKVVREGYPDHTAWDAASEHPDPKSTPEKPIWWMVDIAPLYPLPRQVPLDEVKRAPELSEMALVRQGRLSVQPVTEAEFKAVLAMGGAG
ncbi:MAG: EVE domain-containing protein, partial [Chloroflexota bacterium]|nr:EVE domain-containing protein [Chloroflexota bacterium]